MARLTSVSRADFIRGLRALGYEGPFPGGNHSFMKKGTQKIRVPNPHKGDISAGLLRRILGNAGISRDDWLDAQ